MKSASHLLIEALAGVSCHLACENVGATDCKAYLRNTLSKEIRKYRLDNMLPRQFSIGVRKEATTILKQRGIEAALVVFQVPLTANEHSEGDEIVI